eukprot:GHVU01194572.1.p2 GENE.GHVU01194572.1~~GHVU01194572.1.p2  ORF type:complete len:212 (-),score=15.25 GHVU01194572.1:802-1437(-)
MQTCRLNHYSWPAGFGRLVTICALLCELAVAGRVLVLLPLVLFFHEYRKLPSNFFVVISGVLVRLGPTCSAGCSGSLLSSAMLAVKARHHLGASSLPKSIKMSYRCSLCFFSLLSALGITVMFLSPPSLLSLLLLLPLCAPSYISCTHLPASPSSTPPYPSFLLSPSSPSYICSLSVLSLLPLLLLSPLSNRPTEHSWPSASPHRSCGVPY